MLATLVGADGEPGLVSLSSELGKYPITKNIPSLGGARLGQPIIGGGRISSH